MSKAGKAEPKAKRAAPGHLGPLANLTGTVVTRAPIVDELFPGMTSAAIAAALNSRASGAQVRQWKTGQRPVPAWVREYATVKIERLKRALAETPTGPGREAGWRNVSGYNANR
jgi:hypothetical protein